MYEVKLWCLGSPMVGSDADKFMKPRRFYDEAVAREQAKRLVESEPTLAADVLDVPDTEEETAELRARQQIEALDVSVEEKQVMLSRMRAVRREKAARDAQVTP